MHRSGTSAATRLVTLLGPRPPRTDDLVPPSAKNPTGYWESMSLVALNERLLGALGSDMRWPGRLEPGWEEDVRLDPLRAAAPLVFRGTFPEDPWVWKDPRICLTFSFWKNVPEKPPVLVLVNRNPLEIAGSSLRSGRGEGKRYLLALWERYLRHALSQIEGLPVPVTSYGRLLAQPFDWCEEARAFLAGLGVGVGVADENDVREFVDPALRHVEATREDVLEDADVSPAQRDLFLVLEEMEGSHAAFVAPDLPPETATNDAVFADRKRVLRTDAALAAAKANGLWHRARRLARFLS